MTLDFIGNIGYGGFSAVDLVADATGAQYARKTYMFNQTGTFSDTFKQKCEERFIREVRFLEEMEHPNIVKIIDKNFTCSPPYYLMPVAESVLSDDLKNDRTLGGNQIKVIMDIISAIEELHSLGKFHRDLKPGNVLKFKKPNGELYYTVSDYGLMRDSKSKKTILTTVETQKGSDDYTAPELSNDIRNASIQSDIYSLGCILHDMFGVDPRTPFTEINENSNYGPVFRACTKVNEDLRFENVDDLREEILSIYEACGVVKSSNEEVQEILGKNILDELEAKFLANYIDDKRDKDEGKYILGRISIAHIEQIHILAPKRFRILAKNYCEWILTNSFIFELCDGYANRLLKFYELGGLDIKTECITAILSLGTSHNRFYVEKKAVQLIDTSMEDNLARSLRIEFMTSKTKFCQIIRTLKSSIGYDTSNMHPILKKAYKDNCN